MRHHVKLHKFKTMLKLAAACLFLVGVAWMLTGEFRHFEIIQAERIFLPVQHKKTSVVVGISTFGQRVFQMAPTLTSISSQSRPPDWIIVSIPRTLDRKVAQEPTSCSGFDHDCVTDPVQYDESIPGILAWFAQHTGVDPKDSSQFNQTDRNIFHFPGPLTVLFVDTEWGAGTKVLGALPLLHGYDPATILISLDDDMVYHPSTVEWLATHVVGHQMAVGFACETWDISHTDFVGHSPGFSIIDIILPHPRTCKGWLSGWAAVAYRVGHFGPDIWSFLDSLPRGCFYNDDIWLSGYLARKGIRRVYAPRILEHLHHRRDKALSLSTIDNTREKYGYPCARALFG
jgi:hypothetical protein